jgi:hypothetical protein
MNDKNVQEMLLVDLMFKGMIFVRLIEEKDSNVCRLTEPIVNSQTVPEINSQQMYKSVSN